MAKVQLGNVPFKEAINHFEGKLNLPTPYWDAIDGQTHAKAFTVAGAMKMDLLTDIRSLVNDAHVNGTTFADFRKGFDKAVAKHGWNFKGEPGWRAGVIYDTNLRTARAAGKWQQMQRSKKTRPYLMYLTVDDGAVRPEHWKWHRIILLIDHPWWDTHYAPNDFGCRCYERTLSQRQMEREGLVVSEAPALELVERVNTRTGEVYGEVPKGIGVGWDYNVGKAWLGPDVDFGEKLMALPGDMRTLALDSAGDLTPHLVKDFEPWVARLVNKEAFSSGEIKTLGYLSSGVVQALTERETAPITAVITVTDKDVTHMLRESKDGRQIPAEFIQAMPSMINDPDAVLWDKRDPAVLYVFDVPGDERFGKFVVRVNYRTKARGADGRRYSILSNVVRTGGLVNALNLQDEAVYELLEGSL